MALPTLGVLDKDQVARTINTINSGRQAAADSGSSVLSTEDFAAIGAVTETAPASDTASSGLNGRLQRIAQRLSFMIGLLPTALGAGGGLKIDGSGTVLPVSLPVSQVASNLDCSTLVTRTADTNAYTANDAFANSTSAPTAGGFTFSNAAGAAGGGGIITDLIVVCAGATQYDGELVIFDGAVTAINDNAAFTLTDADALLELGRIPFSLAVKEGQSKAHVTGVNLGYRCIGSTNLRFLVKITNAPTPVSADTINFRIKGIRS